MSKKKIYDIVPPKVAYKLENVVKAMPVGDKPKKAPKKAVDSFKAPEEPKQSLLPPQPAPIPELPPPQKRRFPWWEIIVGGTVIVLLLCIYLYNKLPKADVEIWPKTDVLSLQETIKADKSAVAVDFENKIIPAQYIEVQQDGQQEFQATGSASNDGKATGTITIYNKISPSSSFTLKIGTHFLSDSGKYFVTLDRVVIPGMSKNTPGSVTVKVQAEESGADYNIGPSKFSAPKLSGTSYYYSIWAESKSAMSGGYTGKVKKVTSDNISGAKDVLTKQLLDKAEESLRSKLSSDDILLDGAMTKNIINASADAKEGAIVDEFKESAKVKISALVFKKQDLQAFAKEDILSQLPNTKKFLESSLDLSYTPQSVDITSGTEMINAQLSAKTYYSIDTLSLLDLLSMKSADQIKQVIDQRYGENISELKVNFWPFWVKSAPRDKNRIKVNLNFE